MKMEGWKIMGSDLEILEDKESNLRGEILAVRSKETGRVAAWKWKVFHFEEKVMEGLCNFYADAHEKSEEIIANLQRAY